MSPPASHEERSYGGWRQWLPCWALLWGARLAAAWAVSRPVAVAMGAGTHADRALFEPGGLMLLEVLRLRAETIVDALRASALLLFGAWALLVVVTTTGVALLDRGAGYAGAASSLRATGRALPRVLLLAGLAVGLTLTCVVVFLFGTVAVRSALPPRSSSFAGEIVVVGGISLCLVLLALGGIGFDLMRAHLVRGAPCLKAALHDALFSFRRHAGRLIAGRLAVVVAALLVVIGVAWLVRHQDLARDATGPLLLVFVLHRLGGGLLAGIQVTWMAQVLRACDRPASEASRDDEP